MTGTTRDEWWEWIETVATAKRVVWIFNTNAAEAFNQLGGWQQSEHRGITWGNLESQPGAAPKGKRPPDRRPRCTMLCGPKPVILAHVLNDGRLKWISTTNYTDASIADLAQHVGISYAEDETLLAGRNVYQYRSDVAAAVLDEFFRVWHEEHVDEDRGHWRETAAGLANQLWRRKFYTTKVLVHQSADAARLERRGLFGGRQELFFRGTVGAVPANMPDGGRVPAPRHDATEMGPIYKFDVRSMYVSLLSTQLFPVVFQKHFKNYRWSHFKNAIRFRGCIADVTIETNEPVYPCRMKPRQIRERGRVNDEWRYHTHTFDAFVAYPTGRFRTILAGPDLINALEHGRIAAVHSYSLYRLAPAFAAFGSYCLKIRQTAREANKAITAEVAKLTGNSLAGKLASRGGGWYVKKDHRAVKRWGTWAETTIGDEGPQSFRALAGIVQQFVPPGEGPRAVPSVLCYLTSYGRQFLWSILALCGPQNVLWCDTDGLIVTVDGRDRIMESKHYHETEPGKLRLINEVRSFRGWTPKHYYADGECVLGGFASGAWFDEHGEIRDWRSVGIAGVMDNPESCVSKHVLRRSDTATLTQAGGADQFGYAVPLKLDGKEPRTEKGEVII